MLSIYLRRTVIPLLEFIAVALGVPAVNVLRDRRTGTPLAARTVLGYAAVGIVMGAVLAGALVLPTDVRYFNPPPPPGMR